MLCVTTVPSYRVIVNSTLSFKSRINAIKELTARCPLALTEDLLQDLARYKSHKDKSEYFIVWVCVCVLTKQHDFVYLRSDVTMSARGLIQLFRSLNPKMLHKRDRVSLDL